MRATIVLIHGMPIVPLLYLSQALNALLLLAVLPFMRALARDASVMGPHRLGTADSVATALVIGLVLASVAALALLTLS